MRYSSLFRFCLICSTSCILVVNLVFAQELVIAGKVVDDAGDPLVGATIVCDAHGTYSDLNGEFILQVNDHRGSMRVSYVGFTTRIVDFDLRDTTTELIIMLESMADLLGEVTVTSGKYEQPLGETTVSIEVIKPALLQQTNTTSVDEVLQKIPGVNIIDGQANIRGGSGFSYGAGSRVLVLVDDIPAYQADAGFPNWNDFPVESVAQIEVVKGASSSLYGSSALNGIVNLRTAYAVADPVTKVSVFYNHTGNPALDSRKWWKSAPSEWGVSLSDARRIGKWDLVHSAYLLDGNSHNRDDFNRYGRLNSKLRYRLSNNVEVGLRGSVNRGKNQSFFYWRDADDGAYVGAPGTENTGNYLRYSIDPYLKVINDRGDRHEWRGRIFDVDNRNNAQRSNQSTLFYGEYQYLRRLPKIDAVLTAGLVGLGTKVKAELYGDTTLSSNNLAAFLQFEKKIGERWRLNTGWRYERNAVTGPTRIGDQQIENGKVIESKPVFRFGANYRAGKGTYLRASWGQGYRYPTIAEKYISTSFGSTLVSPNLSLKSETGWSAELGLKQAIDLAGFKALGDVSFFWSEYQDMMEFVFTGLIDGFQSQNIGDTEIRGAELSITGGTNLFGISSFVIAGYTYIDPRFKVFTERDQQNSTADYNILKYRSKHSLKIDYQTDLKRLNFGLSVQYTSNMEAVDRVFYLFIPGIEEFRKSHKGYALTGARLLYNFDSRLKVTLNTYNIFNVEYSPRPGILGPPRKYSLRIDYSL